MNKAIALFVDKESLIAAVETNNGQLVVLQSNGQTKFPFYFFPDARTGKIDYNISYKADYFDNKESVIGNFLESITKPNKTFFWKGEPKPYIHLLSAIIEDIKKQYVEAFKTVGVAIDTNNKIPVNISFADTIAPEVKIVFKNHLFNNNFVFLKDHLSIPQAIVADYMETNKINTRNIDFLVVDALGNHLIMTAVKVDNNFSKTETRQQVVEQFGTESKLVVVAKKIVDTINQREKLISDDAGLKREYNRHIHKAVRVVDLLKNFSKPKIRIETTFATNLNNKLVAAIEVAEINKAVEQRNSQYANLLNQFLNENGLQLSQFAHTLVLGNSITETTVKEAVKNAVGQKVTFYPNNDIQFLIRQLQKEETEAPAIQAEPPVIPPVNEYKEVPMIEVATLKVGQQIKLNNFDPAPGKGGAIQEFEFMGGMLFKVLFSTRTLNAMIGGTVTAITPIWSKGTQVDFNVEINKQKGVFRTRPIVTILLK